MDARRDLPTRQQWDAAAKQFPRIIDRCRHFEITISASRKVRGITKNYRRRPQSDCEPTPEEAAALSSREEDAFAEAYGMRPIEVVQWRPEPTIGDGDNGITQLILSGPILDRCEIERRLNHPTRRMG